MCLSLFLVAAVGASSAQAAGFGCSASALRVTALGQKAEPVTANAAASDCVAASKSLSGAAAGLPAPVSAGAVVAATEVYSAQKSVLASGGAADLRVSTANLPITLPAVTVPDALKTVTVSLKPVKDQIRQVLDPASTGVYEPVLALVEDQKTVDVSGLLQSLLPDGKLPAADLLRIRGAMAYAAGSCQSGSTGVSGTSSVSGVSVLGDAIQLGALVERTLVDSASIDPADVDLSNLALGLPKEFTDLVTLAGVQGVLDSAVASAVAAYNGMDPVKVLDATVAQVKVTPGRQVKSADSVTQQALTVEVSVAGQKLVDAVIGEATVSSAGVDCSGPVIDPGTPAGAALQCSTRKLVLVDVLQRRRGVKLFGFADPALAGRKVDIVFHATGRVVARAKVGTDGRFRTLAPLPPKAVRSSNDARYMARLDGEKSINLKLQRRMVIRSMRSEDGRVTIVGRVVSPLAPGGRAITLTRRVSCNDEKVVKRFTPNRSGRFRITVKAPRGLGTVVYRMTTKVRNSSTGRALFDTYTLPRAVAVKR